MEFIWPRETVLALMMLEVGHLKSSLHSSFSQIILFNFASLLSNKAACTAGAGALSSLQRVTVDGHGPPGPVASKGD